MKVVNLFGGPGSGKSTTASGIFNILKLHQVNVELVTEFAKEKTWEDNKVTLTDQAFVFGNQHFRQHRLIGKVDVIVTDSPLMLSLLYTVEGYPNKEFEAFVMALWNRFDNVNYRINRVKPYSAVGRNQDEAQSDKIGDAVRNLLDRTSVAYRCIDGDEFAAPIIAAEVLKMMGRSSVSRYPAAP